MQGLDENHLPGVGEDHVQNFGEETDVDIDQLIAEFYDHPRIWGSYCVTYLAKKHNLCEEIVQKLEAAIDDLE